MGDLMRLLHRFAELSSAESINTVAVTQTKVSPCNFAFGLTYIGGGFELISSVNAQVGQCVTCRGRAVFTIRTDGECLEFCWCRFSISCITSTLQEQRRKWKSDDLKLFSTPVRDSVTF
jgi:hypothetical protein